jgi:sterol desaturase/sphingolipid hydroxylase (fatty acid hydroxylase superfamily)
MLLLADGFSRVDQLLRLRELSAWLADGVGWLLGLVLSPESVARFAAAVHLTEVARSTVMTLVLLAWVFPVIFLCEVLTRKDRSQYAARTFAQDLLYVFFYRGGFYAILIWSALANAFEPRLAFLKIQMLAGLPAVVHWLLYWVITDFITYWWHRALHTWEPLWAFHSVHHAQEEMSLISSYRLHPVEQIGQNLIMVVPLLVLGVPTFRWLPLYAAMNVMEAAQHSALDWTYGKGYYLLVSPRFHSLHHSTEARHYNRNFSKLFSIWDFLFGTGVYESSRPTRLGVEGLPVPRTIRAQLLAPFSMLFRRARSVA